MSRFSNLEFNRESDESSANQSLVKDEAYHLAQAQTSLERGDFEQALRDYAKVLEYNPQNIAAWTGQVRMLIELGEYREANVWADKALEQYPHEVDLLAAKAVALARTGDLQAALAFSDASLQEQGDTPYIWLARGDVLLARHEKRADYCFEKALAMAPHRWLFYWLASRIYHFYKKLALALRYAQQALALSADQSVIWLQLGLCQQELGMSIQAKTSFEQVLQLNPDNRQAHQALLDNSRQGWVARLRGLWHSRYSP